MSRRLTLEDLHYACFGWRSWDGDSQVLHSPHAAVVRDLACTVLGIEWDRWALHRVVEWLVAKHHCDERKAVKIPLAVLGELLRQEEASRTQARLRRAAGRQGTEVPRDSESQPAAEPSPASQTGAAPRRRRRVRRRRRPPVIYYCGEQTYRVGRSETISVSEKEDNVLQAFLRSEALDGGSSRPSVVRMIRGRFYADCANDTWFSRRPSTAPAARARAAIALAFDRPSLASDGYLTAI